MLSIIQLLSSAPAELPLWVLKQLKLWTMTRPDSWAGFLRLDSINSLIGPALLGMDATKQREIDHMMIDMDGTQNKSKLGANAILSVSMVAAKAAAISSSLPLFYISGNI